MGIETEIHEFIAGYDPFVEGQMPFFILPPPPSFLDRIPEFHGMIRKLSPGPAYTETRINRIKDEISSPYTTFGICELLNKHREHEPIQINVREVTGSPLKDKIEEMEKLSAFFNH